MSAGTPEPEAEFGTILKSAGGGDAPAIIEVAQQAVEPRELDEEKLYAVVGPDGGVHVLDLAEYRDRPDRAKGTYKPATVEAFIAYVGAHERIGETTVWVHPTSGKVVAVLDDTDNVAAGWGSHRVELSMLQTPEWKFWLAQDNKPMKQQAFAEHIEDGMDDIRVPVAAELLEIAQSIHSTNSATFRSGYRLHDGQYNVQYDEQVETSAGTRGELVVPEEFELGLAPFIGEDSFRIKARLRVRPQGGQLSLGYKLENPERAVNTVLEDVAKRIAEKFGERVYIGDAPAG